MNKSFIIYGIPWLYNWQSVSITIYKVNSVVYLLVYAP